MGPDNKPIQVTRPYLPPLSEFINYVERIWDSGILTNNGDLHSRLERELCDYLGVSYISLTCNGTLALLIALRAMNITGEVITTPFSFVASAHALRFLGIEPVFVDIDPDTFNINPYKIKYAITERTSAILPTHVYGNPCAIYEIADIANAYDLAVVYDAAHAFAVRVNGDSVLNAGDLSTLSFHATKIFNTFEGGAIVCADYKMKQKVDLIKNFGISDELNIPRLGINAKMSEIQAAMGLASLQHVSEIIRKRRILANRYFSKLTGISGFTLITLQEGAEWNYAYFPIVINQLYPLNCTDLYHRLRSKNIFVRRYFYPLTSNLCMYKYFPSASPDNLPVANEIAANILCLPIYPSLTEDEQDRVIDELCNASRT